MCNWGQSPFALEMYHWGQSPFALVEVSDCRLTNQVTKGDRPQWHIEKVCELTVSNGSLSRYLAWKASKRLKGARLRSKLK